jgi:dTDP-4-amino-4,6-dideoxygalactose transaminase
MVEPVLNLGCAPKFYRINEDLTADLSDCAARLTDRTRVLLAVNYFGFPQDWAAIRAFCDANDILLIEDCAHSLYGESGGRPLGSNGDYAIASLTKFLPSWDGGAVVSRRFSDRLAGERLTGQGFAGEVKAVVDPLETAAGYGRLGPVRLAVGLGQGLKNALKAIRPAGVSACAEADREINPARRRSGARGEFASEWINTSATFATKVMARLAARRNIADKRRANFRRLVEGFAGRPGCHPLFTDVPDGIVPFMFPLWIDDLPRVFPTLEDRAVPMQRFGQFLWPDVDEATYPMSVSFSRYMIQLPCHQALDEAAIGWIVDQVLEAIRMAGDRRRESA